MPETTLIREHVVRLPALPERTVRWGAIDERLARRLDRREERDVRFAGSMVASWDDGDETQNGHGSLRDRVYLEDVWSATPSDAPDVTS
jgi:hypothetical protein